MPETNEFQDFLENPDQELSATNEEIVKEIDEENEKDYLRELKKKHKGFLVEGLDILEKERIARYIIDRYKDAENKHNELCDKIDEWDEVHRMVRKEVIGAESDMPNYRSPISTVAHEVVHANQMNVFFTPSDWMRVLPTEEGDIPKVGKIDTFGNWSMRNEMDLFTQCDRMFHYSGKTGEAPYIVHWVKEYGTEIVREIIRNPADPSEALIDPDTQEPVYQEREEQKLLYNGPKLETFSRKDYIQPRNAVMDRTPDWEIRKIRLTYDKYLREELAGKMYKGSIKEIKDWGGEQTVESKLDDYEGDNIPFGKFEKEFIEFYGTMRISVIKKDKQDEVEKRQELEQEFIATVNIDSEELCALRINKFPLKMRPIGIDYFIPDDEGRRAGLGIYEMMDGIQKGYDSLYNQYIQGVVQSNNPFGFFTPMGNQRNEPMKIKNGFLFPTSDPNSVNIVKLPPPDGSIQLVLELVNQWAQLLFGISDYAAGVESKIDPSAPAKKAELVVAQGNVRLNMVIKRKAKTLQDIFKRWFLLYKDNMPKNKFMRIVGTSEGNPWKFDAVKLSDFALNSIPDFELVGNALSSNKSLEANKKIAIYQMMMVNPLFNPQVQGGIQRIVQLTSWLIEALDETGLQRIIPDTPGDQIQTPEEENARFLQGDDGEPAPQEDHPNHIAVHRDLLIDPTIPDQVKELVTVHIQAHVKMLQESVTQQLVAQQAGINPAQSQGVNANATTGGTPPQAGTPGGVVQAQPNRVGGLQGGNGTL